MSEAADFLMQALLIGAGATVAIDLWGLAQKRLLGLSPLSYCLVGRWLAYLARGRFRHDPIAASRTPRPAISRLRSLATHAIFGLGLYAAAWLASLF